MTPYDPLIRVLNLIETRKSDMLTAQQLARETYLSVSHLHSLFKLAIGQPLMEYARGRKLAHSLEELVSTDLKVADIAMNYGFQHEQSYIRAFCKEYHCTPGKARKGKMILPIRRRIAPEELRATEQGVLYGPEIVCMPMSHFVGIPYEFRPFHLETQALEPNRLGREFCLRAVGQVSNATDMETYYAIVSSLPGGLTVGLEYMPCVQVRDVSQVPGGYTGRTIPTTLCARFRYTGKHPIQEISMVTARAMFDARTEFFMDQTRYVQRGDIRHIERIDTRLYHEGYCQMELMPPIVDTLAEP